MAARSVLQGLAKDRPAARGLLELLATEGRGWYTETSIQNGTLADNSGFGGLSLPSLQAAVWLENIVVSSNRLALVTVNLPNGSNTVDQRNFRCVVPAGGTVVVPVRMLIRPGHANPLGTSTSFGTAQVAKALDTTTTGTYAWLTAQGTQIYDDLNLSADKVYLHVGDSISAGTGPTTKAKGYEWGVRQFLRAAGNDVRVSNRSVGSTTTTIHESYRAQGWYDATRPDLIIYSLGVNDALTSVATATTLANAQAFIDWKQTVFPDAKLLMLGPSPLTNSTHETTLSAYRTALSAAVTAEADARVAYLSLATAFDRTVSGNYTSGDGVHPLDAGHAAIRDLITAKLTALGWTSL